MLSFCEVLFIYQDGFEMLLTDPPPSSIRLISRQLSTRAQTVKLVAMGSIAVYKQYSDLVRNKLVFFLSPHHVFVEVYQESAIALRAAKMGKEVQVNHQLLFCWSTISLWVWPCLSRWLSRDRIGESTWGF